MKTKQILGSAALSLFLLAGSVIAGETSPMPIAPPTPSPTAKLIRVPKAGTSTAPPTIFELLSMMLSNLGIL